MSKNNIQRCLGKNVVIINGWDIPLKEYEVAWKEKRLLSAQIETSNICDLACRYCFRTEPGTNQKKRLHGEISLDQTKKIIDDVVGLGCKTINIIGAGEPLIDPAFLEIVQYIDAKNAVPVVFTNGASINSDIAETLYKANASVIIKLNSFDHGLQDYLANRKGYARKRDNGLKILIDHGFNKKTEHHDTRLGIDSVVCVENQDEVLTIHKYCRESNIMPLIKTFIPAGKTKTRTDMEISKEKFIELSRKARALDNGQYGIKYKRLLPYLGGVPCTQCGKHSIYVNITGEIYECPGQLKHFGNINSISIKDAFERLHQEQNNFNLGCPPRKAYWNNEIKL